MKAVGYSLVKCLKLIVLNLANFSRLEVGSIVKNIVKILYHLKEISITYCVFRILKVPIPTVKIPYYIIGTDTVLREDCRSRA